MSAASRVAAAAIGVITAVPPVAPASEPGIGMQVWEVVRVSRAPSDFAVSVGAGYGDTRAIIAIAYLRRERTGVKVLPGASMSGHEGTSDVEVYGGGQRASCSRMPVHCTSTHGRITKTAYYNDRGMRDAAAPDTVLVVTSGRGPTVAVTSKVPNQWRVRRVLRAARAVWSSDTASAAGAWSRYAGVEAFSGASAPGGRRGSIAIATPPCSGLQGGTSAGVGSVTLTGGVAPVAASCPHEVLRLSQVARKATTWTLSGTAGGASGLLVSEPGTVRLLVVDF